VQRRADGAVSRFGPMPPVTVRVTTLVSVPVKHLTFKRNCHYQYCMVYIAIKGGGGGGGGDPHWRHEWGGIDEGGGGIHKAGT